MSEQSMTALALANQNRMARKADRRRIKALSCEEGREEVARLLEDPPAHLATLELLTLLGWPFHQFSANSRHLLRLAGVVSELRQVRELTARQRRVLAAGMRTDRRRPSLPELGFVDHDERNAA